MSEKPLSIFPPSLGRGSKTLEALKAAMTNDERTKYQEALHFANPERWPEQGEDETTPRSQSVKLEMTFEDLEKQKEKAKEEEKKGGFGKPVDPRMREGGGTNLKR